MASSQIEIASSSGFGYVLKDPNSRREKRNSNQSSTHKSQSNFQRNLKELVRDHLHSCISISSRGSNSMTDENFNQSSTSSCWGTGKRSHQCPSTKGKQNSTNIWATTQKAKEMTMMVNKEQHNEDQEADVIPLSSISSSASSSMRETSPTQSDSDFSVSSLVQKWREAEARNGHLNNNNNSNNTGIAQAQNSNPSMSSTLESNVSGESSRANSVASVPTFEPTIEGRQGNVDGSSLFGDCQYNKQQEEGDVLVVSNGEAREKIRVADIVRKWAQTSHAGTSDDWGSHYQQPNVLGIGLTRLRIGMDQEGGEQRGMFACPVLCSPRIRGRQAITNLFMRMERERYKEVESLASRQAVSKFPQRGRIQSLLKLRFLRREVSEQEQQPLLSPSVDKHCQRRPSLPRTDRQASFPRTIDSSDKKAMPTITRIREKFNAMTDQGSTSTIIAQRDTNKTNQEEESTSSPNCPTASAQNSYWYFKIKSCMTETIANNRSVKVSMGCNQESQLDCHQEDIPSHQVKTMNNNIDVEVTVQEFQQQAHNRQEENNIERQLHLAKEDPMQHNMVTNAIEYVHEEISLGSIWGENNYEEGANLEMHDSATTSYNNWEEEEEEEEEVEFITKEQAQCPRQFFEPHLEWIADIARPRSYWEGRRQAWYHEVFNTRSKNEEIRQLLERGSVSVVLKSDFRDRMERLVMCSVRRVMHPAIMEEREEDQSTKAFMEQCMSSFDHNYVEDEDEVNKHMAQTKEDIEQGHRKEDKVQNEVDDNEEEDDVDKYYDPTPSPPTQFRWGHCQDLEASYDSDNALSTSIQQPSPVPSFNPNNRGESPVKNALIETELLYDLRAHLEQLYQEMSELRKSVASCIEMQVKLQHSIKEEVSAAVNNLKKQEKVRDSNRRRPKKGNCCICYEKKVDSLLYRCGHICTCFNCAHELQWSNGNCPICRAQIIDVVRAYLDN